MLGKRTIKTDVIELLLASLGQPVSDRSLVVSSRHGRRTGPVGWCYGRLQRTSCARAHRANRIAFALVRDQAGYDPSRRSRED